MPYISQKKRKLYAPKLDPLLKLIAKENYNPGDITYIVYKIVIEAWKNNPVFHCGATIKGICDSVKDEFTRKKLNLYEDRKIEENGDV